MIKECIVCGIPFDAQGNSKTCGAECSEKNRVERLRERDARRAKTGLRREIDARYRAKNREKRRAYAAKYYIENQDAIREKTSRYRAENIEKCRESERCGFRRRRARELLMKNLHPIASNTGA